jgi:multiple sugar transport system substrate-binding protein
MKKALLFFIVTLLIVSITGTYLCAAGKREAAPEAAKEDIFAEPTEIIFWWYGEEDAPGLSKYIQAACDAYNRLHPNITVTPVHQSSVDAVPNFLAAAEVQSGPDIATIWYGVLNLEQVWAGNVAPISDYVSEEEMRHWIGRSFATYDDKVWSVDLYAFGFVVLYYKDHFRDAGLNPEKPPKEWDKFMEASAKLKKAGHDPFSIGFKGGWGFDLYSFYFFLQFLTFNDLLETVAGKQSFSSPAAMWLWEKADEYNRSGYFIRSVTSIDLGESWQEWRSGNATMSPIPNMTAMQWIDELGTDKVGIMSFPTITDKPIDWIPVAPVSEFITSWSPNKELAADFLVFLHSDEAMDLMIDVMDSNLIPADDRFDMSKVKDPVKRQIFEWVHSGFKEGKWFTSGVIPFSILDEGLLPGGQLLVTGDLTPKEAAEKMEKAAEDWRSLNPEALEYFKIWSGIK